MVAASQMRPPCGEAEPVKKLFVIINFFNQGMLIMSRTAKVVHANADGYCVIELMDAAGKIVAFVLLDPNGHSLGAFESLKDALAELSFLMSQKKNPKPPGGNGSSPSFGP